jgi:hypothetical protein
MARRVKNGGQETAEQHDGNELRDKPSTVTIQPHEFRLPDVLSHIEAGRIVRVIPAPQRPAHST